MLALLETKPDQSALQRDLSVTFDRIGDVHLANADLGQALENYRKGLEIAQRLADREPANLLWQRDLSVSHDRVGEVLDRKGDWEGALESFRKGLAIAQTLCRCLRSRSANSGREHEKLEHSR